jgi:biotin transport system substrate-specific component
LFCALSGLLLGARLGLLSQVLYVAIGLSGVPIFTKGGGISYIFQPTFGYLIGFILCAYIIGKMSEKIDNLTFKKALIATLSGLIVLFLIGVPYLYMIFNIYMGKSKTFGWALTAGFIPFIGGDIVLSILVSVIAVKVVRILKRTNLLPHTKYKQEDEK